MEKLTSEQIFNKILKFNPTAHAVVRGSSAYPNLIGNILFYAMGKGSIVLAEVFGLPHSKVPCGERVFGFHIHSGNSCTGTANDPFKNSGMHYDTHNCPHPNHQGDLPPLFGNNGFAFQTFYTERFSTQEIIGKTIIIHDKPDDFVTQPSGNSGNKIACGEIKFFQLWR